MKGLVFTEFLDMVEDRFGMETADAVIDEAATESGGAYTAVGTYNHSELVRMVGALSERADAKPSDLVNAFGIHLFQTFVRKYPRFFEGPTNAFEFLSGIEDVIHVEVRKLYDDAELPKFDCEVHDPNHMTMIYRSSRPFADLAHGLIAGCAAHFGEEIEIVRTDVSGPPTYETRFELRRRA